ncbi:MAG: trehalose-phosphatase [Dehalococcoidia bacterium]|nr:trehalose-phosphatase [Dehalococcoidia bacterium]
MKNILSYWDAIATKIKETEHILLLSDYDGTLTPIVEKPELANLSSQVKEYLRRLAGNSCMTLGIVSGRTLRDLRERIGVDNITYVGNHGLEIEGPDFSFVNPVAREAEPFLHSLSEELSQALVMIKGARVDNKGLTLSLHYRLVDEVQLGEVDRIFHRIVAPSLISDKIRITPSKKAYDIRPAVDWGKGRAIEFIVQRLNKKLAKGNKLLVIFLGDDVTDYDGFYVVNQNKGISIFVGEESAEPEVSYFLRSPNEVYQFLSMLGGVVELNK